MKQKVKQEIWPSDSIHRYPTTDIHQQTYDRPHNNKNRSSNDLKQNIPLKNRSAATNQKSKIVEGDAYELRSECRNCKKLKDKLDQSYKNLQIMNQSLSEINQCYTQKIKIMQETIDRYAVRYQELLIEKKYNIDNTMTEKQKFQSQHLKLIDTLQSVLKQYEQEKKEKQGLLQQIEILEEREKQRQNTLKNNEEGLQKLLAQRMKQIEELKIELAALNYQGQQYELKKKQPSQISNEVQQQNKCKIAKQQQLQGSLQEIPQFEDDQSPEKVPFSQNQEAQDAEGNEGNALREITNQPVKNIQQETRFKSIAPQIIQNSVSEPLIKQ